MITNKTIVTGNGRVIRTRAISSDLGVLVDIMNHLRGANGSKFQSLDGMFWRSYDFDLSTKAVKQQLFSAEVLADEYKEKGYDIDEFRVAGESKNLTFHFRSSNSFSTVSLGVALRHFINDTCRVLEPSIRLLEIKTGQNRKNKNDSLNRYIEQLDKNNIAYSFNGDFFKSLYSEIWNDYKHAESSGITASGYFIDKGKVVYPNIIGSRLNNFKGKKVEDFVDEVLKNVQQFVNSVK